MCHLNSPPVLNNIGERTNHFAFADQILSGRTNIEIECVLVFFRRSFFVSSAQFCREPAILKVIFITRRYDATQLNPINRFFLVVFRPLHHQIVHMTRTLSSFIFVESVFLPQIRSLFLLRSFFVNAVDSFMHDANLKSI